MTTEKEYVDACFLPLGFKDAEGMAGQNYVLEENGRSITVHLSARKKTKTVEPIRVRKYIGHRLELTVDTPVKGRLNIARLTSGPMRFASKTNRWMGSKPVTGLEQFSHLDIWSADPDWASRLLNRSKTEQMLAALLPTDPKFSSTGLKHWPNKITFSVLTNLENITPEQTAEWVNAFKQFVGLLEANRPPVESELVWIERQNPYVATGIYLTVIMAVITIPTLCCCGLLAIPVLLDAM